MQQWHCGIIRMLSLSRTSRPWRGVTRQNHHHHHPSHFSRFFLHFSFLLLASVFSLMRINQKHCSYPRRWQMAITPSCNTLLDHSPSLFPFCWAIPHVRQRRNRSFPSQTKSPRHFLLQQTVGALEDDWEMNPLDWHRLIAHSGLKIGKTRQTVKQIHSISAGIKSGCFTSK